METVDLESDLPARKPSVASVQCRICYDNEKSEDLIAPCHCKGTVAFVHRSCLETWLSESGTTRCELCHQLFNTERTPKYSSTKSIWYWLRYGARHPGTGLRGDVIACTIVTPLAIVVTYVCIYSSEYYGQQKFSQIPAAKWTSVSLLVMIAILLFGYYVWVHSVIRLHARMWYNWWQRSCVVRYIPPSTISLHNRPDDHPIPVPNNTPNPISRNEPDGASDDDSFVNCRPPLINGEFSPNMDLDSPQFQGEGATVKNPEETVIDIEEPDIGSNSTIDLK